MVEVRRDSYDDRVVVVRKSNAGRNIAIVLVLILAVVGVLFATGFWKANISGGDMPTVSVKGGDLPKVDVDSKKVVVGTKKQEIDVPVVGVRDNGDK